MTIQKKNDQLEFERSDQELIDMIKSAWGLPKLSSRELKAFDEELSRRLEARQEFGLVRMILSGVACALAFVLIIFLLTPQPKESDNTHIKTGIQDEIMENWAISLNAPEPDEPYMRNLEQEYQAIASWLSMK
jgi:hypothetical protein